MITERCQSQATTISASTSEATIVTADPNSTIGITCLCITMSGNTVAGTATLRDATAGTIRAIFDLPPTAANPIQPFVVQFDPPLPQTAKNNNWTLQLSANAGSTHVLVTFFRQS